MKSSRKIFALAAIIAAAFGVWWLVVRPTPPSTVTPPSSQPTPAQVDAEEPAKETTPNSAKTIERLGPYSGLSADELWKLRPPMRESHIYPPQTPEEIAMWQWWRAMRQADKKFEHKTPIEFYGKVVDQNNQSVGGAMINLQWSIIGGTESRTLETGSDGRFSITGIQGKGISVYASKAGYLTGLKGKDSFDYGAFFEHNFHVADPNNPMVFQLWKMGESEPMYKWIPSADLSVDGKATSVDMKTGRIASAGDLSFSVLREEQPGSRQSGYTLTVQAANGGGLALSSGEEFMFQAPAVGYQPSIQIMQQAGDPQFQSSQTVRFYLKTSDGKYAAIEAEVAQFNDPVAGLQTLIYYNPSGSRNLEFDDKKQINR